MENQQHILVVVTECNEQQLNQIQHTVELFRQDGARFSLLFAIPQIPAYYYQIPSMALLKEDLVSEAEDCLQRMGKKLQITTEHQWIEMGNFKHIVTQTAHKLGITFTLIMGDTPAETSHANLGKSFDVLPQKLVYAA